MRDPARIDIFCDELAYIWRHYFPDWRFGQLICNLQSFARQDLFYVEEDEFYTLLDKFVLKYK